MTHIQPAFISLSLSIFSHKYAEVPKNNSGLPQSSYLRLNMSHAGGMKTRTIDAARAMVDSARRHRLLLSLLGLLAVFQIVRDEVSSPLLYRVLRGESSYSDITDLYAPPSLTDDSRRALSLDVDSQRALSLDLGGGNCKWQPPQYDVPEEIEFHKTVIAGFPSGDKRMIFIQMEALTGWREYISSYYCLQFVSTIQD